MSSLAGSRPAWPDVRVLGAVFAGGFGGGLARYGLTESWHSAAAAFPWATFAINTAGALALALLVVVLEAMRASPLLRPLLGTGVLGAFTTFSSVVLTVDELAAHGHLRLAALYAGSSVAAGLAAAWAGLLLGRRIAGWHGPDPIAPE